MHTSTIKSQIIITVLLLMAYNVSPAQHTNIMISNQNDPNEPSIAINPKNTNELMAASNINNYYYSTDGGFTWIENTLTSTFGVWGDPVIACDTAEFFYFFHLSNPPGGNWIDRIVCQRTPGIGQAFNNGSYTGLNGTKAQDKQWVDIDRNTNTIYMTWTEFDEYGSFHPADSSRILFSKSANQGASWSNPVRINNVSGDCIDSDNTTEGAVPAVGPNGEVYVSWAGPAGIVFDRSLDGGLTWLSQDIPVDPMPGGWDMTIPGIYRANGLPVTVCDRSGGPNHGTIYINWCDQRNGASDTDVWLSKSTDGGNTWSAPARVNDDLTQTQQFFTWMTIDQTTGYLWFVFYDRRNYTNSSTDVYMAVSKDGGATFYNFQISSTPFVPNSNVFFGDYTNITAHNNVVRPIWTRLDNFNLSVWTAIIDTVILSDEELPADHISLHEQNYPNPVMDETAFSFKLHEPASITIRLFDISGREVCQVVNNQVYGFGKHIIVFRPKDHNISPGTYSYELVAGDKVVRRKMLVVAQ
jgi:hypothetical protein